MNTESSIIRNYQPADRDRYILFHAEAESICRFEDSFLIASLKDESTDPEFRGHGFLGSVSPEFEKNLFLAEIEGKIVGACRVVPETAIDRAVLSLLVAGGFLTSQNSARLLHSALERAAALDVARVHADLKEKDTAARELFEGLGFRPVRRYTEMTLDLQPTSIVEPEHEGLSFRSLEIGEEAKLAELQNLVFGGSWGYCPNTTAKITQQLNAPGCSHGGVIIAYHEEKAIGYCWTSHVDSPDAAVGRIHMMGVVPDVRGQGLGKPVLCSGLKHMASKGIRTVELTTDNENKAACALYEGAGFKPKTVLVWYEKRLKQ